MRFIPTKVHGVLDYAVGVFMLAAPWLLGFSGSAEGTIVALLFGAGAIAYALLTDYELGLYPLLGMPLHNALDVLGGMALAASPFLLNFRDEVWVPHLAVGLFAIAAGLFTRGARDDAPAEALRV
ncbi:MAG: SPW repeat protein [Acetobacteraceae bacterium]|nr:SPW repeat protein [Acetobacteraceae bacterium]